MNNDDRNDTNDMGERRQPQAEAAAAETKSTGIDGLTETGNTSHDRPSLETPQHSEHSKEPYSVFTGWDRYAIVFMASLASLYRFVFE